MPINFRCAACGELLTMPDTFAGQKVQCIACGQRLMVPAPKPPAPVLPNVGKKTVLGSIEPEENPSASSAQTPAATEPLSPFASPFLPQRGKPITSSGLAITSMVCGIVSIVVVCLPFLSIPLALIAIALAVVDLRIGQHGLKGMSVAGLVLGIVAIALVFVWAVFIILAHHSDPNQRFR